MLRILVYNAKDVPCLDCKVKYPNFVMDLDHTRGNKNFALSSMGRNRSLKSVIEEIAKCDPVCANCHRIRTNQRAPIA